MNFGKFPLLECKKKKLTYIRIDNPYGQSVWFIRINNLYNSYESAITMDHTDCQSVWPIQIVNPYVRQIFWLNTSHFYKTIKNIF